jgi:hypothetical protein
MANCAAGALVYADEAAPRQRAGLASPQADALEAALADMTADFSSKVADGRVGQRSETSAHRSRVLRQIAGEFARVQRALTALS